MKKTFTTALRAREMHPFWWLAPPPSPRRGDFILRYALSEGIALRSFIVHCAHPAWDVQVGRSKAPGLPIKALSFCRPTDTAVARELDSQGVVDD